MADKNWSFEEKHIEVYFVEKEMEKKIKEEKIKVLGDLIGKRIKIAFTCWWWEFNGAVKSISGILSGIYYFGGIKQGCIRLDDCKAEKGFQFHYNKLRPKVEIEVSHIREIELVDL